MSSVEIMAPVGSFDALSAAIKAGANSVYFGIEQLNMRARAANNFTTEDLKKIVAICKENNIRSYLALNTIMYDHDITLMQKICDHAKEAGITAVILSDVAAMQYAHSIGLEIHMSTQTNITNIATVKFYAQFADVVVLARELTMQQIKQIVDEIKNQEIKGPSGKLVEVEIFVHGALCVAISGKCYMSIATYNSSANRGACLQNCRRSYRLIDDETGDELKVENKYIMSPKDLCTIGFIDKIIDSGVTIFKIEGRGKPPEYVYTTVKAYREAAEAYQEGTYTQEKIDAWIKELESVFNRGFWHGGYYLGKQLGEWSGEYGSKATKEKTYIGFATNYYQKNKVALFTVQSMEINVGDEILITGPTTGMIQSKVESLFVDEQKVEKAVKGDEITIPIPEKVRPNDKLYTLKEIKNAKDNSLQK